MGRTANQKYFICLLAILLLISTIPYLLAWWSEGENHIFTGLLINPLDGNSYLAKMYQGWEGSWIFQLPFTGEPGEGGYLFLYYLFLGHFSRIVDIPLVLVYHLARLSGAILLALMLWNFVGRIFDQPRYRKLAFALTIFCSGLGWIASLFGMFTSDLWVAEAYPFLSVFINPHFPLGLAILVWILTPKDDWEVPPEGSRQRMYHWTLLFLTAIILGVVMPFGVVVAGAVLAGLLVWNIVTLSLERKNLSMSEFSLSAIVFNKSGISRHLIWLLIGGGPFLVYYYWISTVDPIFSKWSLQNQTPSPTILDFVIAFSPVLLFAIPGAVAVLRKPIPEYRVLFTWSILGIFLIYLPFDLQRRFMLGLFIPISGLAVVGVMNLAGKSVRRTVILSLLIFFLTIPTNMFVILGSIQAGFTHQPLLYLTKEEAIAMSWIVENTTDDAVIFASPQTGTFIPSHTGRRVFYGHPYETIDANQMKKTVEAFFLSGGVQKNDLLSTADYVFWGPRERIFHEELLTGNLPVVFQSGDVKIFRVVQGSID